MAEKLKEKFNCLPYVLLLFIMLCAVLVSQSSVLAIDSSQRY